MDKPFVYKGPISSVTLPKGREVILHPGRTVTLPDDNPYVATLAARGHLVAVPEAAPKAAPEKAAAASSPASNPEPVVEGGPNVR
jgi:hypothetical protein